MNTYKELGKLSETSHNTVHKILLVREHFPDLHNLCIDGKISTDKAYKKAKKRMIDYIIQHRPDLTQKIYNREVKLQSTYRKVKTEIEQGIKHKKQRSLGGSHDSKAKLNFW